MIEKCDSNEQFTRIAMSNTCRAIFFIIYNYLDMLHKLNTKLSEINTSVIVLIKNYNCANKSCTVMRTSEIGQLIVSPVLRTRISTSSLSNVFLLTVIRNG